MKKLMCALLLSATGSASASLVTYSFDLQFSEYGGASDVPARETVANSSITFDLAARSIVNLSMTSQYFDFNSTHSVQTTDEFIDIIPQHMISVPSIALEDNMNQGLDWSISITEFSVYSADGDLDPFMLDDPSITGFAFISKTRPSNANRYWFTWSNLTNIQKITTGEEPAEVPEPASIALLGLGLAGLVRFRRYS